MLYRYIYIHIQPNSFTSSAAAAAAAVISAHGRFMADCFEDVLSGISRVFTGDLQRAGWGASRCSADLRRRREEQRNVCIYRIVYLYIHTFTQADIFVISRCALSLRLILIFLNLSYSSI